MKFPAKIAVCLMAGGGCGGKHGMRGRGGSPTALSRHCGRTAATFFEVILEVILLILLAIGQTHVRAMKLLSGVISMVQATLAVLIPVPLLWNYDMQSKEKN